MFESKVFVGIAVSAALAKALEQTNEYSRNMFIDNQSDYLHETTRDEIRYLGKFIVDVQIDEALPMLTQNIFSLIKRLIPDFESETAQITIFPCAIESPSCETPQKPPATTSS